jgi:hypothetical protein
VRRKRSLNLNLKMGGGGRREGRRNCSCVGLRAFAFYSCFVDIFDRYDCNYIFRSKTKKALLLKLTWLYEIARESWDEVMPTLTNHGYPPCCICLLLKKEEEERCN